MISSMPPEEATVRALGLGAADFISKPFRVRELLARVKAHLRVGRELNQARAEARTRSEMVDILQEVTASLKPEEIYHILVRRVARGLKISKCSLVFATPGEEEAHGGAPPTRTRCCATSASTSAAIPRSGGRSIPGRRCWSPTSPPTRCTPRRATEWEAEGWRCRPARRSPSRSS